MKYNQIHILIKKGLIPYRVLLYHILCSFISYMCFKILTKIWKETVSNGIIDYFHRSHNTLCNGLLSGCWRWTELKVSTMCSLLVTILTVVLSAKLALQVSGECCYATSLSFHISAESKKRCLDFKNAYPFINVKICAVDLCGSLKKPTPCCGRGNCNIFCCNCDNGCHHRNDYVVEDFSQTYEKWVSNVRDH